jgi:hypothetical protein
MVRDRGLLDPRLWVECSRPGRAALTAALRHRSAVARRARWLVGALLCAAGPLTLAYTNAFGLAVLGYSVLCGSGAGSRLRDVGLHRREVVSEARGLRIGFVSGAFGYGAVPFIILFAAALSPQNHAAIFADIGVFILIVVAFCGLFFRDPPLGWWPPDVDPKLWAIDKRVNRSLLSNAPAVRQYAPGQAVRTTTFVVMYLIMVFAAAAFLLAVAYVPIIAISNGFSPVVAASAVWITRRR